MTDRYVIVLFIGALLGIGCGARHEYQVRDLQVTRAGWDTLTVAVTFAQRSALFGLSPASPADKTVLLFNASYDTLYAGADEAIPVPDRALGDSERLMVEVCGCFDQVTVCEQQGINASPKRLRLKEDIAYPEGGAWERGRYALQFVVERKAFDDEGWERLQDHGSIGGYLRAYVDHDEASAVQVPFSRPRGRFDLSRHSNYEDFSYYLKSALLDKEEATVQFDVYAGLAGQTPARLVSVERRLRRKTEEERRQEVRHYAEAAARELLERMGYDTDEREAWAFVESWKHNQLPNTYTVELELTWRLRGRLFGGRYEVDGILEVSADGRHARFRRTDANRRAARVWRDRLGGATVDLGTLDLPEVDDEDRADAETQDYNTVAGVW